MAATKDIKNFTKYPSLSDDDILLGSKTATGGTDAAITVANLKKQMSQDISPVIKNGYWWINGINTGQLAIGKTPQFRFTTKGLEIKYDDEEDTTYRVIIPIEDLLFTFDDLTAEQINSLKLKFSDLTEADKTELRGKAFTYEDFTPAQLADLRLTWDKLTHEQKNEIKGEQGYSAFEVWQQQEGNANKTISDYLAYLRQPATEAATEARKAMTTIQSEADAAIQSATDAAEVAQTAAENVQDGKTPVIEIGTVENGGTAAATLTPAGTDESGNPKSALNLVLPKGKDGEPPVVNYSVLTGQPGTEVQVSQEESGFTPEGNPIYNVTLTIPRGERGLPGLGNGNVYVDGTGLLAGEKYLFVPSATDSTEGTFVKYEDAPADGKTYGRKDGKWSEVKVENALDISWLYDIVNNSESLTISQTQLDLIVNAYNNGFTAAYASDDIGGHIIPMYIVKETDPNVYHISLQMSAAFVDKLSIASNTFNIYPDTLTFEIAVNNVILSTVGGGDKFLSDRGEYKYVEASVQEAPKDGKIYGRKDGAWSEIEVTSKNEVVKIIVTSNQAQPDANLTGAVITVTYAGSDKTFTWNGTELSTDIPVDIEFSVSCSDISGYVTPTTRTFTAIASNTRIVTLSYNTTVTTINVTSNQSGSDFVDDVMVNLSGGIAKTLTGALSYTLNIPTGTTYAITGSEVAPSTDKRYTTPASIQVTAMGVTQTESINYTGSKLNISVAASEGSATPSITVLKNGSTLASYNIASGTTKSIIVPFNSTDKYTITGNNVTNYDTPAAIDNITPNAVTISKTLTYKFLSEQEYSYWVIFDESTPTTTLERGGNEAVRDSIRAKFKRCLAMPQADGKAAIAYLNDTDSTKWPDGSLASDATSNSSGKYVMAYFPKYYYRNEYLGNDKYKFYVSDRKLNDSYKEELECLAGTFEAYKDGVVRLASWANVVSEGSRDANSLYDYANANGSQWGLINYRIHKTIANMFAIMYGNTDISTNNSSIPCSGGTKYYDEVVGKTLELGNADGKVFIEKNIISTSFLGLEDCYSGKFEFIQGLNISLDKAYVIYDGGFFPNKFDSELTAAGATNIRKITVEYSNGGYIKKIAHGEYADVIATEIGASSTTYYADYNYYSTATNYIGARSGWSQNQEECGVYTLTIHQGTNYSNIGTRLAFYGTIEVKTKDEWLALTPDFNG